MDTTLDGHVYKDSCAFECFDTHGHDLLVTTYADITKDYYTLKGGDKMNAICYFDNESTPRLHCACGSPTILDHDCTEIDGEGNPTNANCDLYGLA